MDVRVSGIQSEIRDRKRVREQMKVTMVMKRDNDILWQSFPPSNGFSSLRLTSTWDLPHSSVRSVRSLLRSFIPITLPLWLSLLVSLSNSFCTCKAIDNLRDWMFVSFSHRWHFRIFINRSTAPSRTQIQGRVRYEKEITEKYRSPFSREEEKTLLSEC